MTAASALQLGTTADGAPFTVDLDALIGSHTCVAANTGGGKSGAIRKLLEASYGRLPHLILDPEDEFYTLRERYSYVIAGGDGGDAPATVANAAALARMALENSLSVVAQINDLGEGAADFIAAFCDALIDAPRALWRPLLVVIDEAQRFAPSKGASTATPAIKNLLQRGRKRGYTGIVVSTRVSELDAGVRGLCRNWMLGFVGQALDRRTAADQLGFAQTSAETKGLQTLEPRQFWGFGPALSRLPVLFRVDDVDTTIVKSGQAKVPTPPAPDALREILAALAAPAPSPVVSTGVDNPVDTSARDGRIAELETEVAELRSEVSRLVAVDAECDGYNTGLTAIEQLLVAVRSGAPWPELRHPEKQPGSALAAQDAGVEASPAAGPVVPPTAGGVDVPAAIAAMKTKRGYAVRIGGPPPGAPDAAVRGRRALAALAGIHPATASEAQWATLAGYARTGGTWGTYKSALRAAGLVEQDAFGRWCATAAGVAAAGAEVEPLPPPGRDRAAFWAARVSAGRLVEILGKRWPHWTTRDALAADGGYAASGGTFGTYLGRLRANGLIEEQGKRLRLSAEVMGEAP